MVEKVEAVLESDEQGRDINEVSKTLRELGATEEDIQKRREKHKELEGMIEVFRGWSISCQKTSTT